MKQSTRIHLVEERKRHQWSQQEVADWLGTTQHNVSRWERGQTLPGPYFRAKLCDLFGKSLQELDLLSEDQPLVALPAASETGSSIEATAHGSNLWSVPYPRNPFFTGRQELLHVLHAQLNREHTLALAQSWAISGLGGIGKTQIAVEYVYQYRQDYRYVFWASAATRETLLSGFTTIATLLQLPAKDEHNHARVILAVKQWLTSHGAWLLILDNADDITLVHDMLPTERTGHVLLTTRAQALGSLAQRIEVETMGLAEGTLFLLRRAKHLASDVALDQVPEADLAAAEGIVIEMDFLPLALDQAGAYIEEVGCSLTTYLELYRNHRKELLQRRGHVPTDHPEPVATTWSLSLQKIEQANPAATELLRLCAFLEPDAIPEELISAGGAALGPKLEPITTDVLALNTAIEELRTFSLIQRSPETKQLRIHRLVQAVLRDTMDMAEQRQWAQRAVYATNTIFPASVKATTWSRCQRYLPQAQQCSGFILDYVFTFEEAASLLFRTASYLYDSALYEQAEPLFRRALHIREQVLNSDHPDVAHLLYHIGILYSQQGKYTQAELYHRRALEIREQMLGPDHPDRAASLYRLGALFATQGNYEQAEPLFQRALQTWERTLSPAHPDIAGPLDGLAILYARQDNHEQAEPLFRRALDIREQTLGPDHPDMAASLNNLAEFYQEQGKYAQAEPLYQRALYIWEQTLTPDHLYLAYPLDGLAMLYTQQGNYEQAEPLFQRVLHIREQAQGRQHPAFASALSAFASLRTAQGKHREAVSIYQQALEIQEQILGAAHQATNDTRERLHAALQALAIEESAPS